MRSPLDDNGIQLLEGSGLCQWRSVGVPSSIMLLPRLGWVGVAGVSEGYM